VDKKTLLVILISLAIVILIANEMLSAPANSVSTAEEQPIKVNELVTEGGSEQTISGKSSDNKDDHYLSYVNCGDNKNQFLSDINNLIERADEDTLEFVDNRVEECDKWFDYLSLLNPSDAEKLVGNHKEKKELLISLGSFVPDSQTMGKASKALLTNDDPYVSGLSLHYLLRFDLEFAKKLAQEMNTQNVNFLTASEKFIFLYQCYAGEDCAEGGQIMQDLCQMDPVTCELSYPELVRREVTPNQYDDFILAINSVNSIISSDWFEERDILNPTDP